MSATTTYSFRRSAFTSPPPIAGQFVASKTGKSVLVVKKVTLFRRSGEPVTRDTIRLQVDRLRMEAAPEGIEILPWPIKERVVPDAPVPQAARFYQAARAATSTVGQPRTRKQRKRDLAVQAREFAENADNVVPKAQRVAVMAEDGSVFSPPKAALSSWRDPEQAPNTRAPKMTGGYRRCDPLAVLAKTNSTVTVEHVTAADFYRLAWEKGPGGAIPGGRELTFSDRQFNPSTGPAEHRLDAMTAWIWVQAQFSDQAKACLDAVVLTRQTVSAWAASIGRDRRAAVRYLTKVLDQLLTIYEDDVRDLLRSERVVLD